jgi:hypothetical protein
MKRIPNTRANIYPLLGSPRSTLKLSGKASQPISSTSSHQTTAANAGVVESRPSTANRSLKVPFCRCTAQASSDNCKPLGALVASPGVIVTCWLKSTRPRTLITRCRL